MISADAFQAAAMESGFNFVSSVPCSVLAPLLSPYQSDKKIPCITAASEGEAIGISCGAALAGMNPMVFLQNSGLGNAVNPITSLATVYQIPLLLVIGWRGAPGTKDEPQHDLMGKITADLLSLMGIRIGVLSERPAALKSLFQEALQAINAGTSYAILVREGLIIKEPRPEADRRPNLERHDKKLDLEDLLPSRLDALKCIVKRIDPQTAVLATTGKTGRELVTLTEAEQYLYLAGSMGCASAVGLGVAMCSGKRVVIIDGDGAALMKLGNLATIGHLAPRGLIHVLLDNGCHDSTGGQPTCAPFLDFSGIAKSCNYRSLYKAMTLKELEKALETAMLLDGPHFIHTRIKAGSSISLPRPSVLPVDSKRRFARALQTN